MFVLPVMNLVYTGHQVRSKSNNAFLFIVKMDMTIFYTIR